MEDSSDQSKLFVGGVSWETTEETLREHFSKYGSVVTSVIAKDRLSGSPRGFAFVSFSDPSAVDSALQDSHEILGRTVEVKKAIPRSEQQQSKQQHRNSRSCRTDDEFKTKKIFVGGLSANLSEEEFKSYFEKFGSITDVVVMHDNVTHRPRGFGFITFDSEDAVENVVQNNFHHLNGKQVEVKRAIPKEVSNGGGNGCNARTGSGRGSRHSAHNNHGSYPPYSPSYGFFPSYGSIAEYGGVAGYPFAHGTFDGTYSLGGYYGFSYGVVPYRSPWNSSLAGVGGGPLSSSNSTTIYPNYMNGELRDLSAATNGCNGTVGTQASAESGSDGDVRRAD